MRRLNHPRSRTTARSVAGAVSSPLAGHAVNPSLGARWRHPCRHTVPQPARTPHQTVGRCSCESGLSCGAPQTWSRYVMSERRIQHRSYRAHRPSRQVLACSPSRDLTRHGCRVRAYRDVLAACPAMVGRQGPCTNAQRRGRGVLTACGTRREPVPGGPCGGIHAATRSRNRRGHRTRQLVGCFLESVALGLRWADATFADCASKRLSAARSAVRRVVGSRSRHSGSTIAPHLLLSTMHTDHLDRSLPAHRRGTLRGMDAA
ncbi:hypothetical protein FHT12_003441 [Xanthomonas campestris]|nr:hypothetical protein [Xanthomonas euroxanthea]